jgi:branched-chain amino acid transport system permease protein
VLALLLGYPTLRLRADYLAIVTIAAGEIFRLSVMAPSFREVTGGSDGLSGFNNDWRSLNPLPDGEYGIGFLKFSAAETWSILVGWTLVLLSVLLVYLLIRSPWGRVLKAIREDEDAVRALGKNVFAYKMQSLVLGGCLGALAGIYFVTQQASVVPSKLLDGPDVLRLRVPDPRGHRAHLGAGDRLDDLLGHHHVHRQLPAPGHRCRLLSGSLLDPNQVGQVRLMLVGLGLILLLVFRPQGILGDRRELMLEAR